MNTGFADFFDVWTAKESYVKYTGKGIDDEFSAFSVVSDGRMLEYMDAVCLHRVSIQQGYSACLCCEGNVEIHQIEI